MRRIWVLGLLLLLSWSFATVADGDRAFDAGDYETAIAEYQAAYELRNSNIEALYKLAKAETHLAETLTGDAAEALYQQAADHARAAIAAAPDEAEAHMELARALGRLAQFKGVLQSLNLAGEVKHELERALELNPNHGGAYHALALWNLEVPWVAGGRSGQVRPLFEKSIEVEPDSITHYVDYGEALIRLGDKAAAKVQLDKALALSAKTFGDEEDQAKARDLLSGL